MAKDTIKVTSLLPATPHEIYEAWLDSALHGRMTGGTAAINPTIGGRHTAWDGYIEGTNIELEHGRRIVQTWRTTDFPADAEDSRIEIRLESVDGSTRITIDHVDIPEGQGKGYESGWRDHYFRPMHEYFTDLAADDAEPVTEAMPFASAAAFYATTPPSDDAPTIRAPRVPTMPVTKRAPVLKDSTPKKPVAAKAASKKAAPKKAAPKKAAPKKAAPKKAAPKKAAPKKAAPKKAAPKKAAPKKAAPGRAAPKKAAPKKKAAAKKVSGKKTPARPAAKKARSNARSTKRR